VTGDPWLLRDRSAVPCALACSRTLASLVRSRSFWRVAACADPTYSRLVAFWTLGLAARLLVVACLRIYIRLHVRSWTAMLLLVGECAAFLDLTLLSRQVRLAVRSRNPSQLTPTSRSWAWLQGAGAFLSLPRATCEHRAAHRIICAECCLQPSRKRPERPVAHDRCREECRRGHSRPVVGWRALRFALRSCIRVHHPRSLASRLELCTGLELA
jgi:hypothetical protein